MSDHDTLPTALTQLADRLATPDDRRLIGIAGPPGVGKSSVAAALVERIGPTAIVVPMDGFHLPDAHLREVGLRDVKGAPETFDTSGFVELLAQLRAQTTELIRAPAFDRSIEDSVADAITVLPAHRVVIVEGNYLLLDGPWALVRKLLDETIHLDVDPELRFERLIRRRMASGESRSQAAAWVTRSDEANARIVESVAHRADQIVDVE